MDHPVRSSISSKPVIFRQETDEAGCSQSREFRASSASVKRGGSFQPSQKWTPPVACGLLAGTQRAELLARQADRSRHPRERFEEEQSYLAHQFCGRHYRNQLVGQMTNDK
jgi:branched-subunit amino acid aminotransferase/4-amino-4-deoxychorismate lyase